MYYPVTFAIPPPRHTCLLLALGVISSVGLGQSTARQCTCIDYVDDSCANVGERDQIVLARVLAIELVGTSDNGERMRVDILERFTGTLRPREAIVLGGDDICLQNLSVFDRGDTLVLALVDWTLDFPRGYYALTGRVRRFARLREGRVEGVDLATFREQLPECVARTVGVAEAPMTVTDVRPNPAACQFAIASSGSPIHRYRLYDVAGRLVRAYDSPAAAELDVDVTALPPGTYALDVTTATGHTRHRVSVAH